MLETDDNIMAPYFNTDGSGIRNMEPDRRYPDDVIDQVHTDGLIFAGSIWDWRKLAEDRLGYDDAKATVSRVIVDAMQQNPELADTYDAAVFADDDDGDLSNGTPNFCDLIEAFGQHGLGPSGEGGGLLTIGHDVIENQSPDSSSYPVLADLQNPAPDCFDTEAGNATVMWSIDDGLTWNEAALSVDDEQVTGAIPQVADGSIVQYYLRAEADGTEITAPLNGDRHPFSFAVGDVTEIYCNDFEENDGGWTSELLAGEDTEGADDWQWGTPAGEGGDPDFSYSGRRAWGNDLGRDNYNGEYQNDRHNRLTSPAIDVDGYARVILQYRRWLNVEDGFYDSANILANGEVVWSNHFSDRTAGDEHTTDRQWAIHTVELPADMTSLELAFEIISDGGLTMGGWTVDDVCVYGLSGTPGGGGDDDDGDDDDTGSTDTGIDGDGSGGSIDDNNDPNPSVTAQGYGADGSKATGCACSATEETPASSWLAILGLAGLGLLRRRRD
jgi:MYXO-CTERM domain-containing protein